MEKAVKKINKTRRDSRKQANAVFGPGGISPDARKLEVRLRQNADLTDADIKRIREAFERRDEDGGRSIRAEYARLMSKVEITSLPPSQRTQFRRTLAKAENAVKRDRAILEKKTVKELKQELRNRGLKVSGRKSELIDRLMEE